MSTIAINLPKRLKGFSEADTRSDSLGFVPPGDYEVLDLKENHPTTDTDYAKLKVNNKGEVWVCTRWKDNHYAEFASGPTEGTSTPDLIDVSIPKIEFSDGDAVDEIILVEELKSYDGFTYDLHNPTYPHDLPGISVPKGPPYQNNCCTFAEGLTVKAFADTLPGFEWNNHRHGQMMIFSDQDYFSPVTAAVESGMAIANDDVDSPPPPWTLIQGWKKQWSGGHTFILVDHHPGTDRILTLESNKAYSLNGVGFRKIGMASDFNHKPPEK